MPHALLTDRMRDWITERRKIIDVKPMPVLLDRALQADAYWIHHSDPWHPVRPRTFGSS
jgi:PIN domain nuclease of toxin-antitoxin system